MEVLRENKTLAAIVGVMAVGGIGLAVMLYMAYAGYQATFDQYTTAGNALATLKGAKLFPSSEHVQEREEAVSQYEEAVGKLGTVLLNLQVPVTPMSDTAFQAKLKDNIAKTREAAAAVKMALPKEFAFGFDKYTGNLPKSDEVATQLGDYLAATEAVTKVLIDSGVASIDSFERSPLAIEGDAPQSPPKATEKAPAKSKTKGKGNPKAKAAPVKEISQVVERRTLTVTLTTDQGPLQAVMNNLASPSKMVHFTVVRQLRIDNEKQEGPLRGSLALAPSAPPPGPGGDPSVPAVDPAANPNAPKQPEKAKVIEPVKPADHDSLPVFGLENLKVYMEIDLVRFLEPSSDETASK